jgi:aromatic ring-opening dioxygenase catalytic subunit (LigB family)
MPQPSLFVPHGGGPCFFLEPPTQSSGAGCPPMWRKMRDDLAAILPTLPERPRAILIVSGHWEEPVFTAHVGAAPGLLYDYGGFPAHTYRLDHPAPGAPDVAREAAALLGQAGFATAENDVRGWDHGVFVPMLVIDPAAAIPIAQLSLRHDLDPAAHIAAGQALAPLRADNVLIVGSGMSFHNMRARDGSAIERSRRFDAALVDAVTDPDPEARRRRLADWRSLDEALYAHPREEHLLPLMVALGAGGDDPARHLFQDEVIGWTVSAFRFG